VLGGLLGGGIALLLLLPLFAMGGIGGGDAKLLVMVGAFLGVKPFLAALLATAVFGGAMALFARSGRASPSRCC
jgi:prepilin peptidase CpaA